MRTMSMKLTAPHLRRIGVSNCALMLAALAAAQETSAPPTPAVEGRVQEGEPQDQDGEPQDQDGDPQGEDGDPQGEQRPPENGDAGDSQQAEPPPTDGTREAAGSAEDDTGMPGDLDGMKADDDGEPSEDAAQLDAPRSDGSGREITAEEAARMVDAVEEGQPRVVARPGAAGDKDW